MPDEWLTKNRPGAFQHESFGKNDGWFLGIQMTSLFATITSALAVLPLLNRYAEGIGAGLTRNSAVGVLIYGFWVFGLMGFKRWAIRWLPAVAWVLLVAGVVIFVLPVFVRSPPLPGDVPVVDWFSRSSGLASALGGGIALWLMRDARFRDYHAKAWQRG